MKNSPCPKCGSNEIIRVPGELGVWAGAYNNLIWLGMTIFSAVSVTRYVCGSCGYSEEWIDEKEGIEKLKKKFGTRSHNKS